MASEAAQAAGDLQVQVRFETRLPELYRVPGTTFAVPASLNRYGLSEVVNTLLGTSERPQPFDFLVQGKLLRTSLYKCLLANGLSTESAVAVEYVLAALPPQPAAAASHDDWVSAVCCWGAPGAQGTVATGSYDGSVRIFLSQDMGLTERPSARAVGLQPDGADAAGGIVTAAPRLTLPCHSAPVTSVAMAPQLPGAADSGVLLLSSSKDHTLELSKIHVAGQEVLSEAVATLRGHTSGVQCGDMSRDAKQACSGSWDGDLKLWSLELKAEVAGAEGADEGEGAKEKRRRTDGSTGALPARREVAEECTLRGHTGAVASVSFVEAGAQDPDALDALPPGQVLSGSWDHSLRLWDCSAQVCTHTMTTAHPVLSVSAFGGQHSSLVASGGASKAALIWDLRIKGSTGPALQLSSHKAWVPAVKWCPRRDQPYLLLSASYDGTVKVWDARSTVPLHSVAAHSKNKVLAAAWLSPSSFASGGSDKKLQVFQMPAV